MNRSWTLALLLAFAAALLLRWPGEDQRPMHNDEAVNGVKFGALWERGFYRYDPHEYHGPSLAYSTALLSILSGAPEKISGFSDARLRWVTVLFGLGLIPLLLFFKDGIGRSGLIWSACFLALSPAFVFYSTYYIHEMLLVFFTAALFGCLWRYWLSRRIGWAILAGISLGLVAATKETFVIELAAAFLALVLNHVWNRYFDASGNPVRPAPLKAVHMGVGLISCIVTAGLLFSSFFKNPSGVLDAVRTYFPWLERAGGASDHIHPWYFYWHRLLWFSRQGGPVWTEVFIFLLALIGSASAFLRRNMGDMQASVIRFFFFYTLVLAGVYSGLPYKTPWCLLGFWHGAIILAGVGAAWLIGLEDRRWKRGAVAFLLLLGAAHLGWEAWRLQNVAAVERRNPYVYAQTSRDLLRMVDRLHSLSQVMGPEAMTIKVMALQDDYWPLPWYLRGYRNVGWWDHLPEDPFSPVMIVSGNMGAAFDAKKTHIMSGYYELRPGVFFELYVEVQLWEKFLAAPRNEPER